MFSGNEVHGVLPITHKTCKIEDLSFVTVLKVFI